MHIQKTEQQKNIEKILGIKNLSYFTNGYIRRTYLILLIQDMEKSGKLSQEDIKLLEQEIFFGIPKSEWTNIINELKKSNLHIHLGIYHNTNKVGISESHMWTEEIIKKSERRLSPFAIKMIIGVTGITSETLTEWQRKNIETILRIKNLHCFPSSYFTNGYIRITHLILLIQDMEKSGKLSQEDIKLLEQEIFFGIPKSEWTNIINELKESNLHTHLGIYHNHTNKVDISELYRWTEEIIKKSERQLSPFAIKMIAGVTGIKSETLTEWQRKNINTPPLGKIDKIISNQEVCTKMTQIRGN